MPTDSQENRSRIATSVYVFGVYLVLVGLAFFFVPDAPISLLSLPAASEPYARVAGLLAGIIGTYYIWAARRGIVEFMRATVWARSVAVGGLVLMVATGWATPIFLLFGAVDAAGLLWTFLAGRTGRVAG